MKVLNTSYRPWRRKTKPTKYLKLYKNKYAFGIMKLHLSHETIDIFMEP